jgi:hypothetical protein
MEALDLKKFLWTCGHKNYEILAITTFKNDDIVVYRDLNDTHRVAVLSVDDFCRSFEAVYQISS